MNVHSYLLSEFQMAETGLTTDPIFLKNGSKRQFVLPEKSFDAARDFLSVSLKRKVTGVLICLVVALLSGCTGSEHVYVGPRLDFTPSNGPNYTFPPPKEAQRAGKNVVEAGDAL